MSTPYEVKGKNLLTNNVSERTHRNEGGTYKTLSHTNDLK